MTLLKETSTGRNRQEWVNYLAVLVATARAKGQVKKEFRPDPIRSPGFVAIPFMIKVGGSGWAPESTVHGGVPIGHLRGSRVFGYLSLSRGADSPSGVVASAYLHSPTVFLELR